MREINNATESKDLESNTNPKLANQNSKNNIESKKLDSNDDAIVWELKYETSLETFLRYFLFLFGTFMLIAFFSNSSDEIIVNFFAFIVFFPVTFYMAKLLFYHRKNRIFITNQGMGFERRNWFKMQRKFFKFGEVGLAIANVGTGLVGWEVFIFYPFNHKTLKRLPLFLFLPKNYYKIMMQNTDYCQEIFTFIRHKTKEALESKGILISNEELKEKIKHLTYKDL